MESESRRDVRIVVLGDALITAAGDPKGMGWLGRVIAKTPAVDPRIDFYQLAAPVETSSLLIERWSSEVSRRFSPDTENRLVIALNNLDPAAGVSISRSRLNLATMLDDSTKAGVKCFVVGPTPPRNPALNREIEHLASGYEDVAARRGIPFVDCFRPLVEHEGWNEEIANSPHGLPGQVGHGLLAWLVLNRGWYQWLEIPEAI
ncbi:MAG: GDSL-type esterase/lipase family protein [Micrococcales bacterium]